MKTLRRLAGYVLVYWVRMLTVFVLSISISALYFGTIGSLKPLGDLLFGTGAATALLDDPFFATERGRPIAGWLEANVLSDKARAVYWICAVVLAMTILRNVFRFFQEYHSQAIEKFVIRDVNDELFAKVERLSLQRFHGEEGVAHTISRFSNDSLLLASGVKNMFDKALIEPLQGFGALGLALLIDWQLTMLALLVLPLAGGLVATMGRKVKKRAKRSMERRADLQHVLQESLLGLRVVKAFQMEEAEHARFQKANQDYVDNELRLVRLDAMTSPISETVATVAVLGLVFITAQRVIDKTWNPGDFFAFYAALAALFDPVRKVAKLVNKFQQSIAAGERIFELMDATPEVTDPPGAGDLPRLSESIDFQSVQFEYRKGEPVLHGIDLVVPAGTKLGIVGKTGHGKTTIVNLLLRYYDPTRGRILFDGVDVRQATVASLRRQIGLVSQSVYLFRDSVRNNIARGRPGATLDEIVAAARAAHAEEFILDLPGGYEGIITDDTLSGGQRQRISIARAILKDPAILVLDEATSSLDSRSESLIQDALTEFVRDRTCFIIAHRMSTLSFCDRIVVVDEGRIEANGTHGELLESSPTYRDLFRRQFQLQS